MNLLFEFASSLSTETRWHGNHIFENIPLILKAGRLSVVYENGNLRYISAGSKEKRRMIYSAVRDSSWITIKPVISDELFEINSDSFVISYTAQYSAGEKSGAAGMTLPETIGERGLVLKHLPLRQYP